MFRIVAILFSAILSLSACSDVPSDIYDGNAASPRLSGFNTGSIRLRHLDSVNAIRVENGVQPLQLSAQLNAAADTHARDMAAQQRAWNFGSDHSSPQTRAERAGFAGEVASENVAETFKGELLVLQTWLEDPLSRAAILSPQATHLGYGWYQETNGKVWWVQVLGQVATTPLDGLTAQSE